MSDFIIYNKKKKIPLRWHETVEEFKYDTYNPPGFKLSFYGDRKYFNLTKRVIKHSNLTKEQRVKFENEDEDMSLQTANIVNINGKKVIMIQFKNNETSSILLSNTVKIGKKFISEYNKKDHSIDYIDNESLFFKSNNNILFNDNNEPIQISLPDIHIVKNPSVKSINHILMDSLDCLFISKNRSNNGLLLYIPILDNHTIDDFYNDSSIEGTFFDITKLFQYHGIQNKLTRSPHLVKEQLLYFIENRNDYSNEWYWPRFIYKNDILTMECESRKSNMNYYIVFSKKDLANMIGKLLDYKDVSWI